MRWIWCAQGPAEAPPNGISRPDTRAEPQPLSGVKLISLLA
jgi:hypothetical protein